VRSVTPKELAEAESKPLALAWIASALAAKGGLLKAALETNFAWKQVRDPGAHFDHIEQTLQELDKIIRLSARYFADVDYERAAAIFAPNPVPPAYALYKEKIYFTPEYEKFGPKCRTAMLVHEAVHVIDPRSGEPEIHISEWDPRFETRTALQQLHNPSAYASFTAQIHERAIDWPPEARYGAGQPHV